VATYILVFLGGYLLGSIPVAYLIVKFAKRIDIRRAGSGNVGGFNAFFVTGSKWIGIIVGVLDAAKGFLAVLGAQLLVDSSFWILALALSSAILGHIYPLWLRFEGGRGLATTAGGLFLFGFSYTVVWCVLWLVAKLSGRDILTSNLIAIFATPLILALMPWEVVGLLLPEGTHESSFELFSVILSLLLLLRHQEVLRHIWSGNRQDLEQSST
jgi:glycerol-3-phosphate acyltransferase PlsY